MTPPVGRRRSWTPLPDARRDPVPVRSALDALASTLGLSSVDAVRDLFLRWSEVVGEQLAQHCEPVRLEKGVLTVSVPEPAWATELSWMTASVAQRCCDVLGEGAVESVRISR